MADESILSIILQARDEASEKIKEVGDSVEKAGNSAMNMSAAFKIAGTDVLAVGIAGAGMLKMFADAAVAHETAMASVDTTLRNVASTTGSYSVAVGGGTSATKESKKAIQEQIQALQLQKQQLTLNNEEQTKSITYTTGHGNTLKEHTKIVHENADEINKQKMAIDQQIISLKQQELGTTKSGAATSGVTKIINDASMSYENLKKDADNVAESYLKLGFAENDTELAFAQAVAVTHNTTDAHTMLATAIDLARLKHISLTDATKATTMAYEGNTRMLKQLGIEVDKGAKGMEVIGAIADRTAGQATAYSHTYAGAMEVLGVTFDSVKEKLGERLLPTLTQFALSISSIIDKLNNLSPATYDTIVKVLEFATAFGLIVGPILLVIGFLPTLAAGFAFLGSAILPLTIILAAVALGGYLLYTNWNKISPMLTQVVQAFSQFWTTVQPQIMGFLNTVIQAVQNFVTNNIDTFNNMWITVQAIFVFALGFLQGLWDSTWQLLAFTLMSYLQIIQGALQMAWGAIQIAFAVFMAIFTGKWDKAWGDIQQGWQNLWNGMKTFTSGILDTIGGMIASFANGFIGIINGVISGINSVGSKISGVKTTIPLIPHFDQGGYVPSTGIAMLHAGEFVLSKDMLAGKQQIPSQVSQTTNNNTPVTIYATINQELDLALLGNKLAFAVRNSR